MIVVVAKHPQSEEFQLPVLETQIAAHAIEGFLDSSQPREEQAVLILLIFPVIVQESHSDGRVVPRTRWTCSLDGIAAFRIALQIEFLREANVNVL